MSNRVCRLSLSLLFFVKSKQGAGGKKGEGVVARSESYHERTHTLARSARSARTHAPIIIYICVCAFWEGFGVLGFWYFGVLGLVSVICCCCCVSKFIINRQHLLKHRYNGGTRHVAAVEKQLGG